MGTQMGGKRRANIGNRHARGGPCGIESELFPRHFRRIRSLPVADKGGVVEHEQASRPRWQATVLGGEDVRRVQPGLVNTDDERAVIGCSLGSQQGGGTPAQRVP